jgi:hypothetical protein
VRRERHRRAETYGAVKAIKKDGTFPQELAFSKKVNAISAVLVVDPGDMAKITMVANAVLKLITTKIIVLTRSEMSTVPFSKRRAYHRIH